MITFTRAITKPIVIGIAKIIAKTGITPNQLTTLSIPFALIAAYFLYEGSLNPLNSINWIYAAIWMLIALGIDAVDGALAQVTNKKTNFGNYYDAVVDRIVEIILLAGLAVAFPLLVFLAISFCLLVSYIKARVGLVIVTDNRDWPSLGERSDRLILLWIGVILMIFIPSLQGILVIEIVMYLIVVITGIGSIQRIHFAYHLIKDAEKRGALLPYLKKGGE